MARDPRVRRGAARYQRFSRGAAAAASAGLLGALRRWGDPIGLEGDAASHKRWAFADARHNRTAVDEIVQWEAVVSQALAVGPLDPAWPVAVVTAGAPRGPSWLKDLQAEPARAASDGRVDHVARAGHASLLGARFGDAIVAAIEQVLKGRSA